MESVQLAPEQQEEILCLRARAQIRLHVPLIAHVKTLTRAMTAYTCPCMTDFDVIPS
jgi:hypothetical protein